MWSRRTSTAALAVVVVAALGIWSCGGSSGSPTGVTAIQSDGEGGPVTASSVSHITVCHKGKDLQVASAALGGHLRHGDRLGSCVEACPCFTSAGLAEVAAQCSTPPIASCGAPYSINLFCAPGGSGGVVGNLGYFEAKLGAGTCSTTTQEIETPLPVTAEQFEACHQAIVQSTYYPATCPR